MALNWYVIRAISGKENKIKTYLEKVLNSSLTLSKSELEYLGEKNTNTSKIIKKYSIIIISYLIISTAVILESILKTFVTNKGVEKIKS